MKHIMVFCPTRLKGFDVTYNSIKRQKLNDDVKIIMCVADEYGKERGNDLGDLFNEIGVEYVSFTLAKITGYERNLAACYNKALDFARYMEVDGVVSLQDYIWVPEDGIQKFVDVSDSIEEKHLLTGICHISADPDPSIVADLDGNFTIFEEPYDGEPQEIFWEDVRKQNAERRIPAGEHVTETYPVEWEANWAYIPKEALYDPELKYDEAFDKFVAYENQDYSFKAVENGYKIILDTQNEVKSLPHKKYWPEVEKHEAALTDHNREIIRERYE